ncbi:MAG: aspartate 1-decarboxylase [Cyanobacteria bacterium P01_G01_bin.39]
MTQIKLMHAKLHRVTVTEANVNYVGSITIDQDLMEKVGILPLEEVDVINLANGKRWSTYAIAGTPGSGDICPNGGAALLCEPGDLLIIIAYQYRDRAEVMAKGHHARVIVADEQNHCLKFIQQSLTHQQGKLQFQSNSN